MLTGGIKPPALPTNGIATTSAPANGVVMVIAALAILPILALVWIAFFSTVTTASAWPHLVQYVLPGIAWQTISLLLLVALGTTVFGTVIAWLTSMCEFRGRGMLSWLAVLPLAVPAYIAAYSQLEFLDFTGPVQSALRDFGGYTSSRDYWFPDLRSIGGAALVFTSVLYPYVYMTSRLVFARQGATALDACRSLGAGPMRMFTQIGLPLARPAIAAGLALVMMETLNDIGAVEILGVKTLTYAVFETWLNRDSLVTAVQLAIIVLLVVALLVWLERAARGGRSYHTGSREKMPARITLTKAQSVGAVSFCLLPIGFGLGIPVYILSVYAWRRAGDGLTSEGWVAMGNSLLVSCSSAFLAALIAFGLLQYARLARSNRISATCRVSGFGYAVPGTIIAIGLLVPLAAFDNWIDGLFRAQFDISTGLLLSGSIAVLVYAYVLRFLAVALGAMDTGFGRLSPHMDMAARSLGRTPWQVAWQVHLPSLKGALATAFLLVFVDSMKELSATLLLRPFDFETLATFVYDRASQSALEDASLAALLIVAIGLIPTFLLARGETAAP